MLCVFLFALDAHSDPNNLKTFQLSQSKRASANVTTNVTNVTLQPLKPQLCRGGSLSQFKKSCPFGLQVTVMFCWYHLLKFRWSMIFVLSCNPPPPPPRRVNFPWIFLWDSFFSFHYSLWVEECEIGFSAWALQVTRHLFCGRCLFFAFGGFENVFLVMAV